MIFRKRKGWWLLEEREAGLWVILEDLLYSCPHYNPFEKQMRRKKPPC